MYDTGDAKKCKTFCGEILFEVLFLPFLCYFFIFAPRIYNGSSKKIIASIVLNTP